MNKKTYGQLIKKIGKLSEILRSMMTEYSPEDIFEVILTGAPPEEVELLALFTTNLQAQFIKKAVDIVYQYDAEELEQVELCSTCDDRETCPDRKD